MPFYSSFLTEEQLLCSICLDVFDNPVSTPCGHSFCMACISQYWDSSKHCQCPICKQTFKRKPDLHINRTLREITEQFKQMTGRTGACGGVGSCKQGEEGGETRGSVDGTEKPGHLPGDLFTEMKRKFTRHVKPHVCHHKAEPDQTVTAGGGTTDDPQTPVLTRQVSLRRFTLSGAADAMKVPLCPKHHRHLELFCRSDMDGVCVECRQTEHQSHNIVCAEKEWSASKLKISVTESEIQQMTHDRLQKVEEIRLSLTDINRLAVRETQRHMQLFKALMTSIECSQAGLLEVIEINRRSAEHQAEVMIRELQREISQLRDRSTALVKLAQTEDYITGLRGYCSVSAPVPVKDWTGVSLTCDLGAEALHTSACQLLEHFKEELHKLPTTCGVFVTPVKNETTAPSSGRGFPVAADPSQLLPLSQVKRIQEYAVDVTLDPNTAHPRLILSEDRKKVWCGERHQLVPNSRERFDRVVCVLGCEGFSTGRHYWEVEVGGKTDWDLGVASHSTNRKGKIIPSPSNGYWFLSLRDKNNYAFRTEPSTALNLSQKPQKVGVFVDYEKGQMSFYNVDANVHIYTVIDKFSETIYPFFSPCTNKTGKNEGPLVITSVQ